MSCDVGEVTERLENEQSSVSMGSNRISEFSAGAGERVDGKVNGTSLTWGLL